MGWSSANSIFNNTIQEAIDVGVRGPALQSIAEVLIEALQNQDWDTESESIDEFEAYPEIINAFKESGVRIPCNCTCCVHEGER